MMLVTYLQLAFFSIKINININSKILPNVDSVDFVFYYYYHYLKFE